MGLAEIIDLVQKIGAPAAPVFALLWWLERGERIDAQNELKQIAKDSTVAITTVSGRIAEWVSLFNRSAPK